MQGKRLHGRYFLDQVADHGTEGCSYLLAVDVDMNTVEGYRMASWHSGYGDFVMRPDFGSCGVSHGIRGQPWCKPTSCGRTAPMSSPARQVLKAQLARLADAGLAAYAGPNWSSSSSPTPTNRRGTSGYRHLTPANQYNVDYSILGTSRVEPLLRRIRLSMAEAGMYVEGVKGECNNGQHEIVFKYADALTACDDHVVYKTGAKEIAAQEGMALTTHMAKYDQRRQLPATSTSLCAATTAAWSWPMTPTRWPVATGTVLHRRSDRDMRDMSLLFAQHQLLQTIRRGLVRAHRHQVGPRQPDLRTAPGGHGNPAPGESRTRRGRQPVPGGSRDDRRRA